MKRTKSWTILCLPGVLLLAAVSASAQTTLASVKTTATDPAWQVVVNNGVTVPGDTRKFNSYNQPSINMNKLVVLRARSKGGTTGEPAHGVFLRDMAAGTGLTTLFDRTTVVPQPNDLSTTFREPPAFPRIDMWSNTVVSRGGHSPVWEYVDLTGSDARAGTTGIYTNALGTNPFDSLITGVDNLGAVREFNFFRVPEVQNPDLKFDVFPGAPAVTDKNIIVFKGNYTVGTTSKTGVYYRTLKDQAIGYSYLYPAGGSDPVMVIADSDTVIPGMSEKFGSTAPPSAADFKAVFTGWINEDKPELGGGIYLADLKSTQQPPPLTALVKIGDEVPGQKKGVVFTALGEGLSFDGRFIAFWGAWGSEKRNLVLQCPTDGNKQRVKYCNDEYPNGFPAKVPVHQGIFVHDIVTHSTWTAATSPENFSDFVYWNFSGQAPGVAEGGGEEGGDEDGEPARWRSASFVAVSGLVDGTLKNANMHVAFKAGTGAGANGINATDGIYLRSGPDGQNPFIPLVETGMDGTLFDAAATYTLDEPGNPLPGGPAPLPVTTMGIERDGFRGNALVINVGMGNEAAGWGGIYMMEVAK